MHLWSIVGICVIVASGSSAFYSASDDVVHLTADNFEGSVLYSDGVWIVEFYTTWCGFSRDLVPTYRQVATALKGFIKVGAVNCEESQAEMRICDQIKIDHYPTILIFGADKYRPLEYDGDDTEKGIRWAGLYEYEKLIGQRFQTSATPSEENAHR